ncbi:hypothetical protein IMG5_134500, partial [Ichthyophthirius multifiliis]
NKKINFSSCFTFKYYIFKLNTYTMIQYKKPYHSHSQEYYLSNSINSIIIKIHMNTNLLNYPYNFQILSTQFYLCFQLFLGLTIFLLHQSYLHKPLQNLRYLNNFRYNQQLGHKIYLFFHFAKYSHFLFKQFRFVHSQNQKQLRQYFCDFKQLHIIILYPNYIN